MDLATIIGIISAFVAVIASIIYGGSLIQFFDTPSFLIVFGGSCAATMVRFPLQDISNAIKVGSRIAFTQNKVDPRDLIDELAHLADVSRREGPLGLEKISSDDPNLLKGIQYIADGYDYAVIRDNMERERDLYLMRLTEGRRFYKSMGDAAPAFGMIGTLIGLVNMLATMDDPATIGPSMAIALLTTLYGALVANIICLPIVDKLDAKLDVEELNQTLIIDGTLQIREGKSPSLIREMLLAYIPDHNRELPNESAA
ncbi:motility protein A [Polycladidibacter stylochi]|uniref:motility protein A n=1 Tax=Polycladidibacter stylochi TaxID=1807766 RepID=UPI00082A0F60|nr:MotA/TolQ/ExbB proton channel family protein [Pseudovibrio stylochi]